MKTYFRGPSMEKMLEDSGFSIEISEIEIDTTLLD
jgi:hypothetical protein